MTRGNRPGIVPNLPTTFVGPRTPFAVRASGGEGGATGTGKRLTPAPVALRIGHVVVEGRLDSSTTGEALGAMIAERLETALALHAANLPGAAESKRSVFIVGADAPAPGGAVSGTGRVATALAHAIHDALREPGHREGGGR